MKLKILFFTVLLMHFSLVLSAQNTAEDNTAFPPVPMDEAAQEETFVIVEQMPEFPGGQAALMKYLSSNIKYPDECRKMGIEGKVYVKFVVDKTEPIEDCLISGVDWLKKSFLCFFNFYIIKPISITHTILIFFM